MTTHLDTSPTTFALPALRGAEPGQRDPGVIPAFFGVLLGNIVLWSTLFIGLGILFAVQLGLLGVVGAALLR